MKKNTKKNPSLKETERERMERMSLGYGLSELGLGIAWAGFWLSALKITFSS